MKKMSVDLNQKEIIFVSDLIKSKNKLCSIVIFVIGVYYYWIKNNNQDILYVLYIYLFL